MECSKGRAKVWAENLCQDGLQDNFTFPETQYTPGQEVRRRGDYTLIELENIIFFHCQKCVSLRYRERKSTLALAHPPNGCNGWDWCKVMPGMGDSIQVSHVFAMSQPPQAMCAAHTHLPLPEPHM